MDKYIPAIGITTLFILLSLTHITSGYNKSNFYSEFLNENFISEKGLYRNVFKSYSADNIPDFFEYQSDDVSFNQGSERFEIRDHFGPSSQLHVGPMDSAWPMYCHDTHHTGRSPYSTAGNIGFNKWWFKTDIDNRGYIEGSGVIDKDGVIYFGSWWTFYAMYPNGTLKWQYNIGGEVESSPAIDENGTIYVGIAEGWGTLFAFDPNGTLKWSYGIGDKILSSPVIGEDGTIYIGDGGDWGIKAINPNGTLKWSYKTGHIVYSSPAIGNDGTVYCGSHDTYLYALYPNNGTIKWKYKTGHWIRTSPCIGDDGTIYCVSLDNYLHAVYPNNGTCKWKTNVGAGTSPTIGQDGTIYCGWDKFHAVNPVDGSIRWSFNLGTDRCVEGATPCTSADGTIFFGIHKWYGGSGEIISVNPDGTERWRKKIATEWVNFAPVIDEDGTVYIGSSSKEEIEPGAFISVGYLYAFNEIDANAPSSPDINGPTNGNSKAEIDYIFKSTSSHGNDVYYYIDWGDGDWNIDWWLGPYNSGENAVISHTWSDPGTYTIRSRCKDSDNLWSDWSEFKVTIPRNKVSMGSVWLRFIDMFPILQRILDFLTI
jgi:outer membrane protein assembly factor BamB